MKKLITFLLCIALLTGMSVCFADEETWTCENCGQAPIAGLRNPRRRRMKSSPRHRQERLPSATESAGA